MQKIFNEKKLNRSGVEQMNEKETMQIQNEVKRLWHYMDI
jgi:hypothetical protein